jgi:uncharacterized protein (TIGR03083 family)
MNKIELLEKVTTSRAELEEAIAALSDERLDRPTLAGGWSGKVILAHMAWWEGRVARIFEGLRSGQELTGADFGEPDVDEINRCIETVSRGRALTGVRREEAEAYASLLAQVQAASEDELFNPHCFAWTKDRPLATWVEWDTWGHYEEHIPAFRSL